MGHQFVIPGLVQSLHLTYEKIDLSYFSYHFSLACHSEGEELLLNLLLLFFFPGFGFFSVIYWVQMFKGKFANSLMQLITLITTVGQPQLSWSCLQLPHSRACSLPMHPASTDYRMVMYKVLASGTNSGQLCRAMPASELRTELAQGFLWLHHSSAPLCAQSYLP